LGYAAFDGGPPSRTIYVPAQSLNFYQSETNWAAYADYMVGINTNPYTPISDRFFCAGVATVDAFKGDQLAFTAKTLTESSLTIGTSNEEVRGGQGAGLLGRYYHTSTFELTLTDALFNLEYIRASVGADYIEAAADVLMTEQLKGTGKVSATALTLSKPAVPGFADCADGQTVVWYKKASDDVFQSKFVAAGATTVEGSFDANATYCVKYFYTNNTASKITIKSDYIPDTYRLVLKENLYAAGENNTSKTKIGHVEIIIPRFQLDGSQDLTMSMSGAATTSLKGSALVAEDCDSCDANGYYAEMCQIIDGDVWTNGLLGINVDNG
jgi:hypothetical protein